MENRAPFRLRLILTVSLIVGVPLLSIFAGGTDEELAKYRWNLVQELREDELVYRTVPGAIVAPEIPETDRSVLGAYVRIVRDIVGDIPTRYLDDAEQEAVAVRRIAEKRRELLEAIDRRRNVIERQRITTYRDTDDEPPTVSDDPEVLRLEKQLEALDSITRRDIAVPATAKIQLPEEETYRLRSTLSEPKAAATESMADVFLYLTVDPLDDLHVLTVYQYVPVLDENLVVLRVIAPPEDIPSQLELYRRDIVYAVANETLADLTIRALDSGASVVENARVFLDDTLLGIGSGRDRYARSGTYQAIAITPEGRRVSRTVQLREGDSRDLVLLFEEESFSRVTLRSTPSGASVYRGVLWEGYTPLTILRPAETTSFTLSKEGYHDSRIEIGPETPAFIEGVLVSQDYNWEEDTELKRKKFYRSFGAFALSVGVPILIYGHYQDYTALYPNNIARADLNVEEQERLQGEVDTLFYSYYGSIALSAGLFTHMIWRLVDYVRTAQGYHTR